MDPTQRPMAKIAGQLSDPKGGCVGWFTSDGAVFDSQDGKQIGILVGRTVYDLDGIPLERFKDCVPSVLPMLPWKPI